MSNLSLETNAIVDATLAAVESRQSAITLRMWHYLPHGAAEDMLFVSYRSGAGLTLVQALLTAVHQRSGSSERAAFRVPERLAIKGCDERVAISGAFVQALGDVLGAKSTPMVLNAWRQLLDAFFDESCDGNTPGPA